MYSIISWNVNQYSDIIHGWLKLYIEENIPDIVFISETKRSDEKIKNWLNDIEGYSFIINSHNPSHHHGVVMMIKTGIIFIQISVDMNIPCRGDNYGKNGTEGRVISILLENKYIIVGTYVPNSGYGRNPNNYSYRIGTWDPALQDYLNKCDEKYPTIWIGDINVAPMEIDVSNPEIMCKWAGYTDSERVSLVKFLTGKWADVWRIQHPNDKLYSWRGNVEGCKRYGLRLDNIIVSKRMLRNIKDSFMVEDCPLSDHIPIGIKLD